MLSRVTATAASMSISADRMTCRACYIFLCHGNRQPFERSRHGIAQPVRPLPITAGLRETFGGLLPAHAFGAVPFVVWKREIEAKLTGSFFLFKAVLPRMMAQQ